jgi:hypothetical protein
MLSLNLQAYTSMHINHCYFFLIKNKSACIEERKHIDVPYCLGGAWIHTIG